MRQSACLAFVLLLLLACGGSPSPSATGPAAAPTTESTAAASPSPPSGPTSPAPTSAPATDTATPSAPAAAASSAPAPAASGAGGACLDGIGGRISSCFSWTNLTEAQISSFCPSGLPNRTRAASCPTDKKTSGTCAITVKQGKGSFSYTSTWYDPPPCAIAKASCQTANGMMGATTTWTPASGGGC